MDLKHEVSIIEISPVIITGKTEATKVFQFRNIHGICTYIVLFNFISFQLFTIVFKPTKHIYFSTR